MAARRVPALGVRVYGAAFLALVVFFVWFTYAVFSKKFTDYDEVTLQSSKIGLSLPTRADVKIRGVIVGEVLEVSTAGDGASLTLGLYPETRETVPANVTASILPKTLFGEKYVALEVPESPDGPIRPGAVISQSKVAIELEEVLNDLFPLLRTIQPTQLNFTLTAVANALEGRGEELGQTLETLDSYLGEFNPTVPALLESITKLGQVSATYEAVVPDLARLLRNTVTTAGTLESKERELQELFTNVSGFSATTEEFLAQNEDNLITLADQGRQILPLLAKYAPEYPCFFRAATNIIPREDSAFRNKTLHIVLETLPQQPRTYTVDDRPVNGDKRGAFPYCDLLDKAVDGFYNQENLLPRQLIPDLNDGIEGNVAKRATVGDAVGGTAEEKAIIGMAAAPVLGVPLDEVPDLTTLLLGPLARGMEVNVR